MDPRSTGSWPLPAAVETETVPPARLVVALTSAAVVAVALAAATATVVIVSV